MKTSFRAALQLTALSALFIAFAHPAIAANSLVSPVTKDVAIGLNDVYIPSGFDSNSEAYVVASGLFPNGCYKWKNADVKHLEVYSHEIQSYATVSQGLCIMVMVPFNKEIRLGKLAKGSHSIKFLNGDGTYLQKDMKIE